MCRQSGGGSFILISHKNNWRFFIHICFILKLDITSESDTNDHSGAESKLQKPISIYSHEMDAIANAKPSTLLRLSKQHDTSNGLRKTDGTAVDSVGAAARATVNSQPPSQTSASPLSQSALLLGLVGAQNLQTNSNSTVQRNRNSTGKSAILWNQHGSRTAIKSSSPSATTNNNAASKNFNKTDAPMLNYIFDSHLTNKHRHYDPRYVPVL